MKKRSHSNIGIFNVMEIFISFFFVLCVNAEQNEHQFL